ncbi:unnamed protein product [Parnassius mnemosyne]|uniref:Ig-like domain-containing protein n=1 Tax=Parnassius mnemosyne TaxID=213953 RepID=A0AAV1L4X3_9NEOP
MKYEIISVLNAADKIFDAVINSNASVIENFIIVTFNDPGTILRTDTTDRDEFKKSLKSIKVNGGGDCPELAMSGIELALQASRPGSFIYVYTDANAKDYAKYEKVKKLAIDKEIQIVFVISGICQNHNVTSPGYQVYEKLAESTSGQIFTLGKSQVKQLLNYVARVVESRKTELARKKFPPGYGYKFNCTVDSAVSALDVSVTGSRSSVNITDGDGNAVKVNDIVNISKVKVVNVIDPKPGVHSVEVGSLSDTAVTVLGTTNVDFQYGFSINKPSSRNDTKIPPIAGQKYYLSIELNTEGEMIKLQEVQLLDIKNNIILEERLWIVNTEEQFYVTEQITPPEQIFKIRIKGVKEDTNETIYRVYRSPVAPQMLSDEHPFYAASTYYFRESLRIVSHAHSIGQPAVYSAYSSSKLTKHNPGITNLISYYLELDTFLVIKPYFLLTEPIENKAPIANITGETKLISNYGYPLQLKCIVAGYPEPKIIWEDKLGSSLKFTVSPKRLPYEYISVLYINHIITNNTYFCKASNDIGNYVTSVDVIIKSYFEIVDVSKDKTVKYNEKETLNCKVNAIPPANITWFLNGKEIEMNDQISISSDRSSLFIKQMKPNYAGNFICEVRNNLKRGIYNIKVSITDIEYPKIDKSVTEISVGKGSSVSILCRILKGKPTPTIYWSFKHDKNDVFDNIEEHTENLYIENVNLGMVGTYKCIAKNEIGKDNHVVDLVVEYAPVIKDSKHKKLIQKIGQQTTIKCLADGVPIPDVTWSLNGIEISDGHQYRIYRDNTLKFKASVKNSGEYTCAAVNKLGSAKKTTTVKVFEPVTIDVPKDTNIRVQVGSNLELSCNVKGYPSPTIKWLFISSQTNDKKYLKASDLLVLSRIQLHADGFYICTAKNLGGYVNLTYSVHVDAPPVILTTSSVKNIQAVVGDRVIRIPCYATGNPKPEIRWMRNGRLLSIEPEWYSVETDGTLIVKNVNKASAGSYTCSAENNISIANKNVIVQVDNFPKHNGPIKNIYIEENKPAEIECNIPYERTDLVRWYKRNRMIAEGKLIFSKVKTSNRGRYKCRVSNFVQSKTGTCNVKVGHKPRFTFEAISKLFFDDTNRHLYCTYSAVPKAKITWWFNKKKLAENDMTYCFDNKVSSIGEYKCVVENVFGTIEKKFSVQANDCLLDIAKDFDTYHPLVLANDFRLSDFYIKDGLLAIPIGKSAQFMCSGDFNKFPGTEIKATCLEGKRFKINEDIAEFSKIKCVERMQPVTLKTGKICGYSNTEIIKIGINIKGEFSEFYQICFHKLLKVTLYAQHRLMVYAAGVKSVPTERWLHSDIISYDINEMYDCEQQKNVISTLLNRPFHSEDICCFSARQLVNEKDVTPGLPQISTHSYLNVFPLWNTCNMKNWNSLEELLRMQTRKINRALTITTGISSPLRLFDGTSNVSIYITDKSGEKRLIPQFVWKVVKDYYTAASLAIIQVNVPDLKEDDVKWYTVCDDICHKIFWMKGINWSDVKNGLTYCCSTSEFEKAFGYVAQFSRGCSKILQYLDP